MCAQFHPSEDMVVSASLDQTVRVWDISGELPHYVYCQKCTGHLCIVLLYCIVLFVLLLQWHKCCTCITLRVCDYWRFCHVTVLDLMYLSLDTVTLHFSTSCTLDRASDILRCCNLQNVHVIKESLLKHQKRLIGVSLGSQRYCETSSVISGVTASRNIKQLSFFFLCISFLLQLKIIEQI